MTTESQTAPESASGLPGAGGRPLIAGGRRWRLPIAYGSIASTALALDLALILGSATFAETIYHNIPEAFAGEYSHTIAAAIFALKSRICLPITTLSSLRAVVNWSLSTWPPLYTVLTLLVTALLVSQLADRLAAAIKSMHLATWGTRMRLTSGCSYQAGAIMRSTRCRSNPPIWGRLRRR